MCMNEAKVKSMEVTYKAMSYVGLTVTPRPVNSGGRVKYGSGV